MLGQIERDLYLASRTVGDVQALKRGRYPQRLARRHERRWIFKTLRSLGL